MTVKKAATQDARTKGIVAAMRKAAGLAREKARETGTRVWYGENGRLVSIKPSATK